MMAMTGMRMAQHLLDDVELMLESGFCCDHYPLYRALMHT
jgi:hypothetical protein